MHKLFPSQDEDEKIFLVVRAHWFVLFLKIIVWLFFVAALLLFNFYAPDTLPGLFTGRAELITSLFVQIYTLFLVVSLFLIWLLWYLNIQVVTDRRIVDVDQVGLFSHVVSELHIENIEDVTSETNGLFGHLFGYGMVYVQTAGTKGNFEFDNVPDPGLINKLLLDLYEKVADKNND